MYVIHKKYVTIEDLLMQLLSTGVIFYSTLSQLTMEGGGGPSLLLSLPSSLLFSSVSLGEGEKRIAAVNISRAKRGVKKAKSYRAVQ